eukprot:scaffold300591_cov40-Prasinocladus_malaysianus.AAC.1
MPHRPLYPRARSQPSASASVYSWFAARHVALANCQPPLPAQDISEARGAPRALRSRRPGFHPTELHGTRSPRRCDEQRGSAGCDADDGVEPEAEQRRLDDVRGLGRHLQWGPGLAGELDDARRAEPACVQRLRGGYEAVDLRLRHLLLAHGRQDENHNRHAACRRAVDDDLLSVDVELGGHESLELALQQLKLVGVQVGQREHQPQGLDALALICVGTKHARAGALLAGDRCWHGRRGRRRGIWCGWAGRRGRRRD